MLELRFELGGQMYEQIRKEIASDSFYGNNFSNEGQAGG